MGEIRAISEARKRKQGSGGGKQPGADGLPIIKVVGGELPRVVDEAEAALIAAGAHSLYQRGGEIVRAVVEELPGIDDTTTMSWRIAPASRAHIRECLMLSAQFVKYKTTKGDAEEITVNCPPEVVETYTGRTGLWKLPPLVGIVNTPMLRSDGSLLDAPGYDKRTGLLFEPEGQQFPPIPDTPTMEDAKAARDVFVELLRTFPFVTTADLAVAISGMVTAVVRRSLATAPMHCFDAPSPASGKSLLVDLISLIATGRPAGVISQGDNDKEMESRIIGALLAGHALISLDNCDRPLGGPQLCQVLTQERAYLRRLGSSEMFDTLMNACFFATGNNLVLVDDMTRRALRSTIDAGIERPELREFKGNIRADVRDNRGKYVCAALTIIRGYQVAGRPDLLPPLGSFEQWSEQVRSALYWAGLEDPCMTMAKAGADDPVKASLAAVLTQWDRALQRQETTVTDLMKLVEERDLASNLRYPDFKVALDTVAATRHGLDARKLGQWLSGVKGRVVNGLKLLKSDTLGHGGVAKWYVHRGDRD